MGWLDDYSGTLQQIEQGAVPASTPLPEVQQQEGSWMADYGRAVDSYFQERSQQAYDFAEQAGTYLNYRRVGESVEDAAAAAGRSPKVFADLEYHREGIERAKRLDIVRGLYLDPNEKRDWWSQVRMGTDKGFYNLLSLADNVRAFFAGESTDTGQTYYDPNRTGRPTRSQIREFLFDLDEVANRPENGQTPTFGERVAGGVAQTVAGNVLPAVVTAPLGGGIVTSIGLAGSQAIDEAAYEADRAGLKGSKRAAYIATTGLIEMGVTAAFQKFAPGAEGMLARGAWKEPVQRGARAFGKQVAAELFEEELIAVGQAVADAAYSVKDPDELKNLPQLIGDTAGVTLATMGLLKGTQVIGRATFDFFSREGQQKMLEQVAAKSPDITNDVREADEAMLAEKLALIKKFEDEQFAKLPLEDRLRQTLSQQGRTAADLLNDEKLDEAGNAPSDVLMELFGKSEWLNKVKPALETIAKQDEETGGVDGRLARTSHIEAARRIRREAAAEIAGGLPEAKAVTKAAEDADPSLPPVERDAAGAERDAAARVEYVNARLGRTVAADLQRKTKARAADTAREDAAEIAEQSRGLSDDDLELLYAAIVAEPGDVKPEMQAKVREWMQNPWSAVRWAIKNPSLAKTLAESRGNASSFTLAGLDGMDGQPGASAVRQDFLARVRTVQSLAETHRAILTEFVQTGSANPMPDNALTEAWSPIPKNADWSKEQDVEIFYSPWGSLARRRPADQPPLPIEKMQPVKPVPSVLKAMSAQQRLAAAGDASGDAASRADADRRAALAVIPGIVSTRRRPEEDAGENVSAAEEAAAAQATPQSPAISQAGLLAWAGLSTSSVISVKAKDKYQVMESVQPVSWLVSEFTAPRLAGTAVSEDVPWRGTPVRQRLLGGNVLELTEGDGTIWTFEHIDKPVDKPAEHPQVADPLIPDTSEDAELVVGKEASVAFLRAMGTAAGIRIEEDSAFGRLEYDQKLTGKLTDRIGAVENGVWDGTSLVVTEPHGTTRFSPATKPTGFLRDVARLLGDETGAASPDVMLAAAKRFIGRRRRLPRGENVFAWFKNNPPPKPDNFNSAVPFPIYHGGLSAYREFDFDRLGQNTHAVTTNLGVFFAMEPAITLRYAASAEDSAIQARSRFRSFVDNGDDNAELLGEKWRPITELKEVIAANKRKAIDDAERELASAKTELAASRKASDAERLRQAEQNLANREYLLDQVTKAARTLETAARSPAAGRIQIADYRATDDAANWLRQMADTTGVSGPQPERLPFVGHRAIYQGYIDTKRPLFLGHGENAQDIKLIGDHFSIASVEAWARLREIASVPQARQKLIDLGFDSIVVETGEASAQAVSEKPTLQFVIALKSDVLRNFEEVILYRNEDSATLELDPANRVRDELITPQPMLNKQSPVMAFSQDEGGYLDLNRIASAAESALRSGVPALRVWFNRLFDGDRNLPRGTTVLLERHLTQAAAEVVSARQTLADYRTLTQSYGPAWNESLERSFNSAIRGDAMAVLPGEMRTVARRMRAHQDVLSNAFLRLGTTDGDLAALIREGLGTYFHRYYLGFHDPLANKRRVDADPELLGRAQAFFRKQYPTYTDRQIDNAIDDFLLKPMEMLRREAGARTPLGKMDVRQLLERQNMPKVLRDLLGEETRPEVVYARSIELTASMIARHKFLAGLRAQHMGSLFFAEDDPERPRGFNHRIADDENMTMSPLAGLYTSQEIADDLYAFAPQRTKGLARAYSVAAGLAKMAKTIGDPLSYARNVHGVFGFLALHGVSDAKSLGEGAKVVWQMLNPSSEAARQELELATRYGVLHLGVDTGALAESLRTFEAGDMTASVEGGWKRAASVAGAAYNAPDVFARYVAWRSLAAKYSAAYKKAGVDKSEDDILKMAAEAVNDTFPTYSRAPLAIKRLAENPLVASFPRWTWEVYRTAMGVGKLIARELRDPVLRSVGQRHLLGATGAVMLLEEGLRALAMWATGTDEEELTAARTLLPEYERFGFHVPIGRDSAGNLIVINTSRSNVWSPVRDVAYAVARGDNWWETAQHVVTNPFTEPEILTKALVEAYTNTGEDGKRLFNPESATYERDRFLHVAKAMEPGILMRTRKIATAAAGGDMEKAERELVAAVFGVRGMVVDPAKVLSRAAYDYGDRVRNISAAFNVEVADRNASKVHLVESYQRANARRISEQMQLTRLIRASQVLGMPADEIESVLSSSGMAVADVKAIEAGDTVPLDIATPQLERIVRQSPDDDAGKEKVAALFRANMQALESVTGGREAALRRFTKLSRQRLPGYSPRTFATRQQWLRERQEAERVRNLAAAAVRLLGNGQQAAE